MNKIFLFPFILLLSSCSLYDLITEPTTECQEDEIFIYRSGHLYPSYVVAGENKGYAGCKAYIPKEKLEDFVVNHNYRKDGTKRYNNTDKVIRVLKWGDEKDKRKVTFRSGVYDGRGKCVKRNDLIFLDEGLYLCYGTTQ